MSFIGNIIWFLTGGGFMGLSWYLAGIFWTMTIIGIPAGKQCFKIGTLCLFPFGKYVLSPVGGTGMRTPPGKCMLTAGRCACVPAELCTHSA